MQIILNIKNKNPFFLITGKSSIIKTVLKQRCIILLITFLDYFVGYAIVVVKQSVVNSKAGLELFFI